MRLNYLRHVIDEHKFVFLYDNEIASHLVLVQVFNQYADDPDLDFGEDDIEDCTSLLLRQLHGKQGTE